MAIVCCSTILLSSCHSKSGGQGSVAEKTAEEKEDDSVVELTVDFDRARQDVEKGTFRATGPNGEQLSEDEELALAAFTNAMLKEALNNMVAESLDLLREPMESLEIPEEMQEPLTDLLDEAHPESAITIYIFQKREGAAPIKTIDLTIEGETLIRCCHINAANEQPYALISYSRTIDSEPVVTETLLTYDDTNEWTSTISKTEQKEIFSEP